MDPFYYIKADSFEKGYYAVMEQIMLYGEESSPRGQKIKELRGMHLEITNPRKRLIFNGQRDLNLFFNMGECLWYLSGSNDVEQVSFYNKAWRKYSDDGKTLNSAYGNRIFGNESRVGFDQWKTIIELLRRDPDSRQAIIHIHLPKDLFESSKDVPCTLHFQFFIRGGKLEMHTTMRSNDIIWGSTYDIFSFTMFQELIALELGIPMGGYHHHVGSWHIYDYHEELCKKILSNQVSDEWSLEMLVMKEVDLNLLNYMLAVEKQIRLADGPKTTSVIGVVAAQSHLTQYWRDWLVVLLCHKFWRLNDIENYKQVMAYSNHVYLPFLERKLVSWQS